MTCIVNNINSASLLTAVMDLLAHAQSIDRADRQAIVNDRTGAMQMKRWHGQTTSDFTRVMLVFGVPSAIGIAAGWLAMTRAGNKVLFVA